MYLLIDPELNFVCHSASPQAMLALCTSSFNGSPNISLPQLVYLWKRDSSAEHRRLLLRMDAVIDEITIGAVTRIADRPPNITKKPCVMASTGANTPVLAKSQGSALGRPVPPQEHLEDVGYVR
jgi:hypothetical protein